MQAPPFFVSFENRDDFYSALSKETLVEHKQELEALLDKKLPPVVSIRCLATLFGYSPKFVGSLMYRTDKYYRIFKIRSGKKKRVIEAPKVGLKVVQKWLAAHLSQAVSFDECVYGFVQGRSYISAAKRHTKAAWVYSIDIKDFFQRTPTEKLVLAFKELGYSEEASEIAAKLCSYKGHLAQGSPASPVLSNVVFRRLDKKINKLASDLGVTYTRYADDLVFSGSKDFPEKIREVKALVEEQGWELAEHKEHLAKLPNRLKVHGLLVHGDNVRLTKGYRNKIRAYQHMLDAKKISAEDVCKIKGHITLAQHIESEANP